jgi:lipopolysaccharide export LptBFGC system permease protein LptF
MILTIYFIICILTYYIMFKISRKVNEGLLFPIVGALIWPITILVALSHVIDLSKEDRTQLFNEFRDKNNYL